MQQLPILRSLLPVSNLRQQGKCVLERAYRSGMPRSNLLACTWLLYHLGPSAPGSLGLGTCAVGSRSGESIRRQS